MLPQYIESDKRIGSTETIQEKADTCLALNLQGILIINTGMDNFDEIYSNHRNSQEIQSLKGSWTYQEQIQLYRLHDQMGNKWSMIAEYFQNRNDNSVKNHFYSRLRKALRRLNKIISVQMKKSMKEIKNNVIYKIIEVTEERHKISGQDANSAQVTELCRELKRRLLDFSYEQGQIQQQQSDFFTVGKKLIEDLVSFNRQYRRKAKKTSTQVKEPKLILKTKKSKSQKQQNNLNLISVSQCSLFESQSSQSQANRSSTGQVTTRRRAKSGEFKCLKRLQTGISVPQRIVPNQKIVKEQYENFFKQSSLLEDHLLYMPEFMKKQFNNIHKMIQDVPQFQFIDENDNYNEKMEDQDHFSDPFLSQGNFSLFK